MVLWNLGSVSDQIFNQIDDIPLSVSGEPLLNIIDKKRIKSEKFLGASTIGSTAIAEQYQDPILLLSIAHLNRIIEGQGSDASSLKIAEFTVKKGGGSAALKLADMYEADAMEQLRELKGKYRYYKALG